MGDHHPLAVRDWPPDYDTATCTHRHTILATAAALQLAPGTDPSELEGRHVPVTIYHWSPPIVRILLTIIMPPTAFRILKGFTPLGTFPVVDYLNLSKPLSSLLATEPFVSLQHGAAGIADPTPYLLTDLIARLPVPQSPDSEDNHPHQGKGLQQHLDFFTFPVLSRSPDELLPGNGTGPAWKWAKPESVYRKAGPWNPDLAKVLEEGEWSAGKGLLLLVKGVVGPEQKREGGELIDL